MADNTYKPKGSFAKLMSSQVPAPGQREMQESPSQKAGGRDESQSTSQSVNQSVDQLTDYKRDMSTISPNTVVDRPKAFYITKRLDRDLDMAVRYFQEVHGIKKADRSTVINAILDNEANWTNQSLDQLADRLISELTNRLTSRPTDK